MSKQAYARTSLLVRFMLRRDRIRIPVWIAAISSITFLTAQAFVNLYVTEESRQSLAETMYNPAMLAMVGQGYGLSNYTYGAIMAHQMLLFTAITVAIMGILLVTRHTRLDEEEGRVELIRSLPVGRLSHLSAAMMVLFITNISLAAVVGFGLYALQIESMDLQGSLLYGAALGAAGLFFAALTAFCAQLSDNSRGTMGFALAVLILAYIIRAIGDAGTEMLSWFSPLGWILGAEVYVNNLWWPIVVTMIASIGLAAFAMYLNAHRDLGSGLIQAKPGRRGASVLLQSPLGLAFRLQRTGIMAWAAGLFVIGLSYGAVLGDLESFLADVELFEELLNPAEGISIVDQFLTVIMSVVVILASIPVLMTLLKLKSEENRNRLEHLTSRAVSRTWILGSYYVLAVVVGFIGYNKRDLHG